MSPPPPPPPATHTHKRNIPIFSSRKNCTRVGLSLPPGKLGKWGSHGLRRRGLESLGEAGLGDTASMQFGGHRSVEGLKSYRDGSRKTRKVLTAAAFNGSATTPRQRTHLTTTAAAYSPPILAAVLPSASPQFLPPSALRVVSGAAAVPNLHAAHTLAPPRTPMAPFEGSSFSFPVPCALSAVQQPAQSTVKADLRVAKESFQEGLISQEEYQATKGAILSRLH